MPDGHLTEAISFENGTYVFTDYPDVPITRSIFGDYYRFTGDVYAHLIIERDNIVVDGAGHKLQLERPGGFAISAGIWDNSHDRPEFVGAENVVITNIIIEEFSYGIELGGSNNEVSAITLTGGEPGGKAIWDSGSSNAVHECRIFGNQGSGIYIAGTGAVISDNYIADNGEVGIEFFSSAGSLRRNTLVNNGQAFYFYDMPASSNVIDPSNTVDGKPVYCWVNEYGKTVTPEAGYVLLSNCTNITVQGVSILNSSDGSARNSNGIYLYSTRDSLVRRNYLQAGAGIRLDNSCQNVTITENYFGNGGTSITSSSNVSIITNKFQTTGISLTSTTGCLVFNNTFSRCAAGVSLQGAHQNRIQQNSITDCDLGVSIFKSDENVFSSNNFVGNKQDVWEGHTTWEWPFDKYYESVNNIWDGNFWSNYTGRDANRDGVGDTPHTIYENKRDNFPLMSALIIHELVLEPTNSSSPSDGTEGTSAPSASGENVAAVVAVVLIVVAVAAVGLGLLVHSKKRQPKSGAKT
jgi:parallel beta-helix repeat protein